MVTLLTDNAPSVRLYRKPKLKVLVLNRYTEEQYAVRSIKAGASGYRTNSSASKELLRAIRKAFSGGKYITSSVT